MSGMFPIAPAHIRKNTMHILHVAGALKGGPLSAVADWTRYQLAAGHKVSLVYSPVRDPLDTFRDALAAEIELHALEIPRDIRIATDYRACRKLVNIVRVTRPDVIHLHSSKSGAIGRIAAILCGTPTIYSPHGVSYLRTDVGILTRALYFALEWLLGCLGALTVACSPSELHALKLIPGRKLMIPNGIDLASIPDKKPRSADGFRIVLCGRITAQKNPSSPPGLQKCRRKIGIGCGLVMAN